MCLKSHQSSLVPYTVCDFSYVFRNYRNSFVYMMQHVECALPIECTDFVILTEKPPRSSQDLGHARQAFMLTLKASSMEPW